MLFTSFYILGGVVVLGGSLGLLLQSVLEPTASCKRYQLHLSAALVALVLLIGTLGFHSIEHRPPVHSFYWAVVTVSTVGYGGTTPQSDAGRLFVACFMLVGVGSTGRLLADLSVLPVEAHRRRCASFSLSSFTDHLHPQPQSSSSSSHLSTS